MQETRPRRLVPFLKEHWQVPVFGVAVLSLLLLWRRIHVEERRIEQGKDVYQQALDDYDSGRFNAASREFAEFLDRYPKHPDRGHAFYYLANCRLHTAKEGDKDRLVLALDALHHAEEEGFPKEQTRQRRLDVAQRLLDEGAAAAALPELHLLARETGDPSLQLLIADAAESLLDEVVASRVLAASMVGMVPPGPGAGVARETALEEVMRSPLIEEALAALDDYAEQDPAGKRADVLLRRGRLFLRQHLYAEAEEALGKVIDSVRPRISPWTSMVFPDFASAAAAGIEAYSLRGKVCLGRMHSWTDPLRVEDAFQRGVNDLLRGESLARRAGDVASAEEMAYLLGRAWHSHGKLAEAITAYEQLLSRNPSPVARYACLTRMGQIFLARGDVSKGLDVLDRALLSVSAGALADTRFPELPEPSLLLRGFPRPGDTPEQLSRAASIAEGFLAHYPNDSALHEIDADILDHLGVADDASAEEARRRGQAREREALRLEEEARDHHARAASAYARAADLEVGSAAAVLRFHAGRAYSRAKDPLHAIQFLKSYLDNCPRDDQNQPEAIYLLAKAERVKGDYDLARALFTRLASDYPNNLPFTYPSLLDVAETYRAQGDLDGAIRSLSEVLLMSDRLQPASEVWKTAKFTIGDVWFEAARTREGEAKREALHQARRELEQALKYYPQEARMGIRARDTLADIAIEEEDWGRALEHYKEVLRLGDVMDANGVAAKEEEPYQTIYRTASLRKADCLFKQGKLQAAEQAYQEAYTQNFQARTALDCLYRRAQCLKELNQTQAYDRVIDLAKGRLDRLAGSGAMTEEEVTRWRGLLHE